MEILPYILKLSAYWLVLYLCYALFLRQQTFLRWNRAYLLASLVAGFVLPLVTYPEAAPPMPVVYEVSMATFTVATATPTASLLTWENALWLVYFLGVVFMLGRLLRHFTQLFSLIRKGEGIAMDDHTLVLLDHDHTGDASPGEASRGETSPDISTLGSFSFLHWIVISRSDYESNFDTILNHELVHVRQRHSWDVIFLEILQVVFWFNPILIIYKKTIQQVHEYLADEKAKADNRDRYAEFLVSYALGAPNTVLTNQFFNQSFLKNRIVMLYKNKNSNWSLGKYAAVALMIGFTALTVASCERDVVPTSANGEEMVKGNINVTGIINTPDHKPLRGATVSDSEGKKSTTTDAAGRFSLKVPSGRDLKVSAPGFGTMDLKVNPKYRNADYDIAMSTKDGRPSNMRSAPSTDGQSVKVTVQTGEINGETIFSVVENQPEFPGGIQEMYKFLAQNIKYPEAAAKAKVSGKVFVNFVVTTEGEIRDITILKGIGFGADQEAIRMVKNMPRWKPGMQSGKAVNVRYNLPISFQIDGGNGENSDSGIKVTTYADAKPIYVVDGIVKEDDFSFEKMEKKNIIRMKSLKGKEATDKYGAKAADGVIELTTKKK